MAASSYDGLYWEGNVPLGLHKTVHDLMGRNAKNPNTPDQSVPSSSDRQWLSLPRSATSYKLKHSIYTFGDSADFFAQDDARWITGTETTPDFGKDFDYDQPGYGAEIARSLDRGNFNWFPIAYNSRAFPLNIGVQNAVDQAVRHILGNSSKIILIGHGKGAVVTSKLYNEFRTGRLNSRRSDLLGIFNFGNPLREEGHTIPNGLDPGGHGIAPASERLTDTEELVWEFAAPGDAMTIQDDSLRGDIASFLYTKFDTSIDNPNTLHDEMMEILDNPLFGRIDALVPFRLAVSNGEPLRLHELIRTLKREFFSSRGQHDNYQNFHPRSGSQLNAIDMTTVAIQNILIANPLPTVSSSPTEVLTVNYRTPVSISEISFEILRKNSYTELWFLDRSGNWRQMLEENSTPINVKVGHSDDLTSWYKYHTMTYPIVAKAIQFRITRVADPFVGEDSYPVGIRNTLVRRNVYSRSAGLQSLEDEVDAMGNIISKVIKDWDASKAIDNNGDTFWRSFPQPDPDAVVSLYLDTRDEEGNAQLIDKVYLDPVYTGQALNLYYSNDSTAASKKLNPASLLPAAEYKIGSTVAMSGNGSTATITLDTSPNIVIGDTITISGASPSEYNGDHIVNLVSYNTPYRISFASTATGSQVLPGVVTTSGQQNFEWTSGKGLQDTVQEDSDTSLYRCPLTVGPMISEDCWIGVQWTPSFNAFMEKLPIIPLTTTGVTKVGSTATVSLNSAPNVSVGDSITISEMAPTGYNGTHVVTAVSNSEPYSLSFTTTATGDQTYAGTVITNNFVIGEKDISVLSASGTGSVATLVLEDNPKVVVGDLITVSGVTPTEYNGIHTVTAVSSTAPYSVSFSSAASGTQTVAGKVDVGGKVVLKGLNSPIFDNIYSVYDTTTGEVLYSRGKDKSTSTFNETTKVLRFPGGNIPSHCTILDGLMVFYGSNGPAPTQLTLFEVVPDNTTGQQSWPKLVYDTTGGQFTLVIANPKGASPLTHSAPLELPFEANTPIHIVVGWKYVEGGDPQVYISARTGRQQRIAGIETTSTNFPTKITFDGKIGFKQWRGTFGAHIVKQESYSLSSNNFLVNPSVYCNPDPVLIGSNATTSPATSLDNAIMAVDWTTQQFASGGAHSSSYSDKEWTPIWVNYFSEKGFLYLPETISMKYLKLEFTQLTPEPYPIYDEGIKVSYQVYPISITQTYKRKGLVGNANNILGGIGSVNWLNPSTVNQAVNSVFGKTVQPIQTQLQIGPGYTTDALPNTTQTAVSEATRTEANSPWVYRRTPVNPFSLVHNFFQKIFANKDQGVPSFIPDTQVALLNEQTSVTTPTNASPGALPIQGQDWYIFPGQTLRMPSNVVDGVSKSEVVTRRDKSKTVRTRFTTTAVHQYETKTVTLDASIAYFAGVREVQPYVVTYIDYEDPPEFKFDNYDSSLGWSQVNIQKYDSGPITAKPNPYIVVNGGFNYSLQGWTGTGWAWDTSEGHTLSESWQPGTPFMYGSAHVEADGTKKTLTSTEIEVEYPSSSNEVNVIAWVVYKDITYEPGARIYVDLVGLNNNGTVDSSIGLQSFMEISQGSGFPEQNYFDTNQPCSSVKQIGVKAIPLYGHAALSSSITKFKVRLNVEGITSGDIWFDDIIAEPLAGTVGSVQKTIVTKSKFSKVKCQFKDSGVKRSDPMWAFADSNAVNDPRRTILAHYVSTVPDRIPNGTWGDSFGTWSDTNVEWGTPYSVVSVNYSEAVFDKKRVIHFYRQASGSSAVGQAGITVRQELNFVSNGLFRICALFFKEKQTTNTMEFRLTRVSGNEAGKEGPQQYLNGVIHAETVKNSEDETKPLADNEFRTGTWHTHQGKWMEIPDSLDQTYKLEMVLSGDQEDDIYLNDLWVEISQIRYHIKLGGENNHDVTPIVYKDNCTVGTTNQVNEMQIQVEIHGSNSYLYTYNNDSKENDSFAYSSVFTPLYLQ